MPFRVNVSPVGGKLNQLLIFNGNTMIGEYERSQDADIDRKKKEIHNAEDLLLDVFQNYGQFVVRWTRNGRKKSIRVNGTEVATIPRNAWEKPSWECKN